MKWLKWSGLGALVLLAVLAGLVFFALDAVIRIGVERGGEYATGVDTGLERANMRIGQGRLRLTGFELANPEGFEAEHFLRMENGEMELRLRSLIEDEVHIPRIELSGIGLELELRDGRGNYQAILDHMERLKGPEDERPQTEGTEYIIDEILIRDVQVKAVAQIPGGQRLHEFTIRLDDIRLENIGSRTEGGVLLSQVTGIVLEALLEQVLAQTGGILPGRMLDDLRGALPDLAGLTDFDASALGAGAGEVVEELLGGEAVDDLGEDVRERLREDGDGLREGVEELFRRNDD